MIFDSGTPGDQLLNSHQKERNQGKTTRLSQDHPPLAHEELFLVWGGGKLTDSGGK